MSDIVACDVCGGTGYDERTRLTLHKRPCPLGCEVPDPHSRSATGPAPAWLRDAMRRGKAIEEEAERDKAHFRKLESEAAEHVETVICMRTHFTGEPPYVGWEGLGLALREALDERDRLRDENERLKRVIGRESINVGAVTRYLAMAAPSEYSAREARRMLDEVEVALGGAYVAGKGGVNG